MAKSKETDAPTGSFAEREWRGGKAYYCTTPGCVFTSESKAAAFVHAGTGAHRIPRARQLEASTKAAAGKRDDA